MSRENESCRVADWNNLPFFLSSQEDDDDDDDGPRVVSPTSPDTSSSNHNPRLLCTTPRKRKRGREARGAGKEGTKPTSAQGGRASDPRKRWARWRASGRTHACNFASAVRDRSRHRGFPSFRAYYSPIFEARSLQRWEVAQWARKVNPSNLYTANRTFLSEAYYIIGRN